MSANSFDFLYDHTEDTRTRFVCFITPSLQRFDLAITSTSRFYGKQLITDIQSGKTAIIGPDDLNEPGYLEYVYKLSEEDGEDLRNFLIEVVGMINFTDI
ncbi:DUF3055 domain-containing protein [Paenibacillus mesophilus]|uniref:DUF3055 domain-containing protein n=1 Tax=Paenibacillus mesophilus TaxID=2582849 RepID=UPI00110D6850|nr:DUF3055 domain-containing protein [Paenibacillus mesophilus]TMV45461.1 DUF3055 domain-containing protein [Paenibacillus mesophilus]